MIQIISLDRTTRKWSKPHLLPFSFGCTGATNHRQNFKVGSNSAGPQREGIKQMKTVLALVLWLFLLLDAAIGAQYNFTDVKVPGARFTIAHGINDLGDVVGHFSLDDFSPIQGFIYSDGQYFDIDIPDAFAVVPFGISRSGVTVGSFNDGGRQAAFVMDDDKITILDVPRADGVNSRGTVVGYRTVGAINQQAYSWKQGVFTAIATPDDFPGSVGSAATGINDREHVVGYYFFDAGDCCHEIHGFIKRGKKVVTFDSPLGATFPLGINNKGEIVGFAGDVSFVFSKGEFTEINVPDACCTSVRGINNKGQIVGYYIKGGEGIGFIGSPVKAAGRKK
jgi:probable HAF family extracellular repeat protein